MSYAHIHKTGASSPLPLSVPSLIVTPCLERRSCRDPLNAEVLARGSSVLGIANYYAVQLIPSAHTHSMRTFDDSCGMYLYHRCKND